VAASRLRHLRCLRSKKNAATMGLIDSILRTCSKKSANPPSLTTSD